MRAMRKYYSIAILLFMILSACTNRATKLAKSTPPSDGSHTSEQENPRILILQFAAFRTKSGADSITLESANVVPGFLKQDMMEEPSAIPAGKLRCTLLDSNGNPLKSTVLDHPLEKSIELPPRTENEEHSNAKLNVEKGAIIVRARFTKDIKSVVLEKSDKNSNPEYRIKFDIL